MDFLSKQEARSAADAVAGTHLYGRRLVSHSSVHTSMRFPSQQTMSHVDSISLAYKACLREGRSQSLKLSYKLRFPISIPICFGISVAASVVLTGLSGVQVIEWADADEGGLDELRAKTAARFRPDEEDAPVAKKQRKALDLAE